MEIIKNIKSLLLIYKIPFILKGIFFILFLEIHSQDNEINQLFIKDIKTSLKHKPKLDFRFDTRQSFILSNRAQIFGINLGVNFNNILKIGIGYNQLISTIKTSFFITNNLGVNTYTSFKLKLQYLSIYGEYVFTHHKKWEISLYAMLGLGKTYFNTVNEENKKKYRQKFILLWEPYMSAQYPVFKFFYIGAGIGYRIPFISNKFFFTSIISPIYVLKIKIIIPFDKLLNN